MENIKEIIKNTGLDLSPISKIEGFEILEKQEIKTLETNIISDVKSFIRKKQAKIREIEYTKKISQPIEFEKLDYSAQLKNFLLDYKKYSGKKFENTEWNKLIVRLLCLYFTNDKSFENEGFSLDKNILLYGNVGTGKTTILDSFRFNQRQSFRSVSCRNISSAYQEKGLEGINIYTSFPKCHDPRGVYNQTHFGYMFDDFGYDRAVTNYGNTVEPMEEVLENLYRKDWRHKIHITTNLSRDQIEKRYGSRLLSRMYEMFNFIAFPSGAPDMRKLNFSKK